MAAPSMSPTRRPTKMLSLAQGPAAAPVLIRKSVSYPWWRTDLRISTGAAAGPWARESIFVGLLVGDIEGAAIQTYQVPTPIPRALRATHSHRLHQLIVQLPQRFPAQP